MLQDDTLWDWVFSCFDEKSGGFGGHTGQDGHMLYTLSALQVLALGDRLSDDRLPRERVIQFIVNRQQSSDGSFTGDAWGEVDTRFTYCALQSLALLQAVDRINVDAACAYVMACRNADGSFGCIPGAESHAGQVFTCVGALAIAQRLHLLHDLELNHDHALAVWLSERQVDSGGLNGRPEKQADVCYSWWILSTLSILGKTRWVHGRKLAHFILSCQDDVDGGIADRPDDMADVYHTFFGSAGLSLLGYLHLDKSDDGETGQPINTSAYQRIDPVYALPTSVVQKLNLPGQVIQSEGELLDDRLAHYTILRDHQDEAS
jgi:geranylgeranyl transferase type-2 subunit beta